MEINAHYKHNYKIFKRERERETERERERERERKRERERERVKHRFFVTFNIIIGHVFENLIEIPQVVQKI